MSGSRRFTLAFFIAPLAVPILASLPDLLSPYTVLSTELVMLAILLVGFVTGFVLLGMPTIFILRRFSKLTVLNLALAGALLGAFFGPSVLYFGGDDFTVAQAFDRYTMLMFGMMGMTTALIFGLVAGVQRF